MTSKPYQQCTRCVMDTSDAEICFDAQGYCNHCTDYFELLAHQVYHGEDSDKLLDALIADVKKAGQRKAYDCVIGISGGVDSIYTAMQAKKFGLRVLAVHMDNGWNSELAVNNIEKILKVLEIDLHTAVLDWQEFRELQLAFLRASVPEAETPTDIAIPAVLHKYAAQYGVKYIFSGGNYVTEGILPKSWHYDAKDVKYIKSINRMFGSGKLKSFPTFGYLKESWYKIFKGIRMIYPLNLLPYNKRDALSMLETELDWKNYGGKHHESLYTKWVQSYLLPEKFGIDYRKATYSTQICAGEITRAQAIEELKKPPFDAQKIKEDTEYLCKKLCIHPSELEAIMQLPPKSYKDYPNNKKWLEFVYGMYRKVKS